MKAAVQLPNDPTLHQATLAYGSDFGFVRTAMPLRAFSYYQPEIRCVGLDHAMWFHDSFRFDDCPCWIPTTRQVVKLPPSRMRCTS